LSVPTQRSVEQDKSDILAIAAARRLRDLAFGPFGGLIAASLRVVPRQERSMESVERMLAAVERLARRSRSFDLLTLEAVAAEAHVTPQAAYRYFRDVDDMVRLYARRVQTVEHERLLAALIEPRFETAADLADTAVSFVAEAYRQIFAAPARIRAQLARDYANVCYGLVWTLSEIVSSTMDRRGDPCAGLGPVPLSAALVAAMSVAISFCLRDDRLLPGSRAQAMMLDIFLTALAARTTNSDPNER
jgi:AcrR family transcriptional regulator